VLGRDREAMLLRLYPGVSVRRIARELRVSRWTVHRVLDRLSVPKAPGSLLERRSSPGSVLLDDGPVKRSPVVPT
jgi:hypothetical protein